jgi:hypothetical protein
MDDRADRDARARRTDITNSQGIQFGDRGIQVNLFAGGRPVGPVVAGNGLADGLQTAWGPENETTVRLRAILADLRPEAGE